MLILRRKSFWNREKVQGIIIIYLNLDINEQLQGSIRLMLIYDKKKYQLDIWASIAY